MWRGSLACVMLVTVSLGTIARVQTAPRDLRGIYICSSDVTQISKGYANEVDAALALPGADGLVVVIGWSAVEPVMGQFEFAVLDEWINKAISLERKIE